MQTVIHIGCPKTGTTTLQRHLFRELPGVHYLGHYSRLNPKLQRPIAPGVTSRYRKTGARPWPGRPQTLSAFSIPRKS